MVSYILKSKVQFTGLPLNILQLIQGQYGKNKFPSWFCHALLDVLRYIT